MASKKEINDLKLSLEDLNSMFTGIAAKITESIKQQSKELDGVTKRVTNSYSRDFNNAINKVKKSLEDQSKLKSSLTGKNNKEERALAEKLSKQNEKAFDEIQKAITAANQLKREGLEVDEEQLEKLIEQNRERKKELDEAKALSDELKNTQSVGSLVREGFAGFANRLDESGSLAKLLTGELSLQQKIQLSLAAAFALFVKGVFDASDNIANIAKSTGVSAD